MENFRRISHAIDVRPFIQEIDSVKNAWSIHRGRKEKVKVQRDADAISLRGLRKSKIAGGKRRDVHESRFTSASKLFPAIRSFLLESAATLDGELSRAKVVRLPPGGVVYPHIDRGEYYRIRDRYHFVLQSDEGNLLTCDDEEIWMKAGELWWFDNKKEHSAVNASNTPRIHIIFDLFHKPGAIQPQPRRSRDIQQSARPGLLS